MSKLILGDGLLGSELVKQTKWDCISRKKDKYLIIALPNMNAPEIKFLGKDWAPWDAPRHLYHFSPSTATSLLKKYGFKKSTGYIHVSKVSHR